MELVAKLYKKQFEGGIIFLHENLAHATSWALPCIKNILREVYVEINEAYQCMYGLKTWDTSWAQLVLAKKPSKFMTNSRAIGAELKRKCDGKKRDHQPLVDGRATDVAMYPGALCQFISLGSSSKRGSGC